MSLESILEHILSEANAQKELIMKEAKQQAERIIQQARLEAERLYGVSMSREKTLAENSRQKIIVNARLEAKKDLLKTRQELIDNVFENLKSELSKTKLKKKQITQDKIQEVAEDIDFYLNQIRPDYENEIAKIIFA